MTTPACRNCGNEDERPVFADLGFQPLANQYLTREQLDAPISTYPLVPTLCGNCGLIQLPSLAEREDIFQTYAYYSSQSDHWVKHVHDYARDMQARYNLDQYSNVMEIASNDGATLREFRALGIPAVGIEPAENIAIVANLDGLATVPAFMGVELAEDLLSNGYRGANLITANNVVAHVPDLEDFLTGISMLLRPDGALTVEFPDANLMVRDNQFDQIYHEHFSYFTEYAAIDTLRRRGLHHVRTDHFPDLHGGTIRVTAVPGSRWTLPEHCYRSFGQPTPEMLEYKDKPPAFRREFVDLMNHYKNFGQTIAGYGAPAKGNTLLNYSGLDSDTISYVVDSTPDKQGKYLPGSRIPIFSPSHLDENPPDVIVIMAWNWTQEIMKKIESHKQRGAIIISRLDIL